MHDPDENDEGHDEHEHEHHDEHDVTKNPWFNDEIAAIVKLHRKTIRKFHRSKTKKTELKQLCKTLEKKKRKLIKAAKQKYGEQMAMNGGGGNNGDDDGDGGEHECMNHGQVLPKTHIQNVRQLDASLMPNVQIPRFLKTASQQIYDICDTYL